MYIHKRKPVGNTQEPTNCKFEKLRERSELQNLQNLHSKALTVDDAVVTFILQPNNCVKLELQLRPVGYRMTTNICTTKPFYFGSFEHM